MKKPSDVIKRLSQVRTDAQIPQEEVAKKMRCGQPKVSRLENGDDIRLGDLLRYARAVGFENVVLQVKSKRG